MKKTKSIIPLSFFSCLLCLSLLLILGGCSDNKIGNSREVPQKKDSPFGIHAVGLPYFSEVGELGCSIVRIIITTQVWDMIENESGLDFSKLDSAVRTLQKQGLDIVFTIMPNSKRWGAAHLFEKTQETRLEPTIHADYPADFDLYKKTIKAIVERYSGDGKGDMPGLAYPIDYYQLVNEWVWQWRGTKEQYLKYLIDSRKIIKEAHPDAKIILGGLTGVEFWAISERIDKVREVKLGGMRGKDKPEIMEFEALKRQKPGHIENMITRIKFIMDHGQPYFDIIDLHTYTENYDEMIPSIEILKKKAPGKELWSLENAGPFYRYSPEKHCSELIKRYIVGLRHGVSKIFWSSYNPTGGWSDNFQNLSLLTERGNKKPAYFVYKFLAHHFSNIQSVEKMDAAGPHIQAYKLFLKNQEDVFVAWSDRQKEEAVRLPIRVPHDTLRLISFRLQLLQRIQKLEKNVSVQNDEVKVEISETPVLIGKNL